MISFEKFKVGCLGTDGSFGTTSGHVLQVAIKIVQIEYKVLDIKCISLAYRRRLGRLVVGITKYRQCFVFFAECGEIGNKVQQAVS